MCKVHRPGAGPRQVMHAGPPATEGNRLYYVGVWALKALVASLAAGPIIRQQHCTWCTPGGGNALRLPLLALGGDQQQPQPGFTSQSAASLSVRSGSTAPSASADTSRCAATWLSRHRRERLRTSSRVS